jgi:hypothetical protein
MAADCLLLDRITLADSPHAWHNDHRPAYGVYPTSIWPDAGWVLSESYLVVPEVLQPDDRGRIRPLGLAGGFLEGDLVPGELWLDVATVDSEGAIGGHLGPSRPSDGWPAVERTPVDRRTPEGWDRMTWIGGLLVPIAEHVRRRASG